jgi:hypothetical protein
MLSTHPSAQTRAMLGALLGVPGMGKVEGADVLELPPGGV